MEVLASRIGPKTRLVLLALVLAGAFGVAYHYGLLDARHREQLQVFLGTLGYWGPPVFMAIKVVTIIFALPSAPVTFMGGVLFGPVWGSVINVVAATTGACCTFFIGRKLGREAVEDKLKGRLKEMDEGFAQNGLSFMLFLRLVPLFPFNGINYGAGLTRVSFRDYFWGTLLGMIPGATVFTYMGSAAADASPRNFLLGLAALGLLALIPVFVPKRKGASDGES